jgi:hypothetical protein
MLELSGVCLGKSFNLAESFLRNMTIKIATVSMVPKETPTPMPARALVDNEDWMWEGEEPGEADAVAEGIFGPTS